MDATAVDTQELALRERLHCIIRKWKLEHNGSTHQLTVEFVYRRFLHRRHGTVSEQRVREIVAQVLSEPV
jgi:hypothetical protein